MALVSLRKRLINAFGVRGRSPLTAPGVRVQGLGQPSLGGGGGVEATLIDAIDKKQTVKFLYDDKWEEDGAPGKSGMRVGDPHAIWIGSNGVKYLHLYINPQSVSASGGPTGWRTFLVNRIRQVAPANAGAQFFDSNVQFVRAPGWSPGWYSRVGTPVKLIN